MSTPAPSFLRRVLTLVAGTVGAQAVLLAAVPVVTRLYTPADLGAHAVFAALLLALVALANLRYEYAIPLVDDDAAGRALTRLCLVTSAAVGAVVLVPSWLGAQALASALGQPALAAWLPWLAPSVVAGGVFQALNYALVRDQAFRAIAIGRVTQSVGTGGTWIGAGWLGLTPGGLFAGEVVGRAASALALGVQWRRGRAASSADVPLIHTAREHAVYPRLVLPATVLNLASVHLQPLLLAAWFPASVVGWFALTVRLLQTPVRLFGHAVGQVYMSTVGSLQGDALASSTRDTLRRLLVVGTIPTAVVAVLGPDLVAVVFGEPWRPAGHMLRWLAPWLWLVFIGSPLTSLVLARGRQRAELVFQVALFALRLAALVVGGLAGDAMLAVALLGAVGVVAWLPYVVWLLRLGEVEPRAIVRTAGMSMGIAGAALLPLTVLVAMGTPAWHPAALAALGLAMAVWLWDVRRGLA